MRIFKSLLPEVVIPNAALTGVVFRHVDRLADKTAVIDGPTDRRYSYGEMYEAIKRVAGGLVAMGLGKGSVVAILAPNIPEYAIVFHAVAMAGGTVTTINPTYTVREINFQLQDSAALCLVTVPMLLDTARAASEGTNVDEVLVIGEADGARSVSELLTSDPLETQVEIDPTEHVVVLPYSSGTTGLPKGVQLTHRNLVANLSQGEPLSIVTEDDVIVAVLPFFHIYGMQVLMNGVLYNGATAVTMPRFDLGEFLALIQKHGVTRVNVVPPIVVALAKHPMVGEYDLSTLREIWSGAAPLSAEVEDEAARRTGAVIMQGYGLTETSPVTHTLLSGHPRSGSIGVPISNTEVRVVDTGTGEDLDAGADGEIWIRGPQVMKGYLNNPQATAASIDDDGWLRTGDIGRVDGEGYWYITDRLKELIKYKGFQVAPAELEALLLTHPAVADAAVVPVADEEAGEIPKGYVVLRPGAEASAEEIMAHVAAQVANFKQIRLLEFIDEIPKSASGKILRRVLVERERAAGG